MCAVLGRGFLVVCSRGPSSVYCGRGRQLTRNSVIRKGMVVSGMIAMQGQNEADRRGDVIRPSPALSPHVMINRLGDRHKSSATAVSPPCPTLLNSHCMQLWIALLLHHPAGLGSAARSSWERSSSPRVRPSVDKFPAARDRHRHHIATQPRVCPLLHPIKPPEAAPTAAFIAE